MHSSRLHALAHRLLVWSGQHLLSLQAAHVPGVLNMGADLLTRGNPLYGDWRLHPQIVSAMLCKRFGQADVDLFTSCENTHCSMFFSLEVFTSPLGSENPRSDLSHCSITFTHNQSAGPGDFSGGCAHVNAVYVRLQSGSKINAVGSGQTRD